MRLSPACPDKINALLLPLHSQSRVEPSSPKTLKSQTSEEGRCWLQAAQKQAAQELQKLKEARQQREVAEAPSEAPFELQVCSGVGTVPLPHGLSSMPLSGKCASTCPLLWTDLLHWFQTSIPPP